MRLRLIMTPICLALSSCVFFVFLSRPQGSFVTSRSFLSSSSLGIQREVRVNVYGQCHSIVDRIEQQIIV